jgi:subtilisin family serine protease
MAAARAGAASEGVNVRILPVKVLDCAGDGRASQAAAGVRYAARSGARVIVLAFSGTSDVPALREAVAEARGTYGAVVVAAAGNDSGVVTQFPSGYPDVLGVGGTGVVNPSDGEVDYGRLAPFSNLSEGVRVLAPAVGIRGPVPPALCGQRDWVCTSAEPSASASGTSYATPLVAGALALLLAYDPTLTPDEAMDLLVETASPIHGSAVGQIDVSAALVRARWWRDGGPSAWSASGDGFE